jgi:hypothetical protein
MNANFIIRARDGRLWQTSRGFVSTDPKDATLYSSREEATNVRAFCCPVRARAEVVEVGASTTTQQPQGAKP